MDVWTIAFPHNNASLRLPRWARKCGRCKVDLLSSEIRSGSTFCCGGPKNTTHRYRELPPLPPQIQDLLSHRDISSMSRKLNLIFSFAAMETTANFGDIPGSFVTIQGRVYHRVRPNHKSSSIRWILYDGFVDATAPHVRYFDQIPLLWIDSVREALIEVNPFVGRLREMSSMPAAQAATAHVELLDRAQPELVALMQFDNTSVNTITPRSLTIRKGDDSTLQIRATSSLYEPLVYPLFFPHGTVGWGVDDSPDCDDSLMWHLRQRLLREDRFQIFGRLTGEYVCDNYSRSMEMRLAYVKANLKRLNKEDADLMGEEYIPDDENIFLPGSFLGSTQWTHNNISNALAIAAVHGNPSFFVTITCNQSWPEIRSKLRPGQTATDIPTVVVRAFKARLHVAITALKTMFPNSGGVLYNMHCIEFQKRGFPHAHILIKYRRDCITGSDIDQVVSAELPDDPGDRALVKRYMIHTHGPYCLRDGDSCRFNFPRPLSETTIVDSKGHITYRRRHAESAWVVAHNIQLLRLLDCHINFEVANTASLFQYLFKYVYKGPDYMKYRLALERRENAERVDEISDYWNGRYLTAAEATWRLFGFHITRKEPAVTPLPVHLETNIHRHQRYRTNSNVITLSPLLRYFYRPAGTYVLNGVVKLFHDLKYIEYHQHFRIASRSEALPRHAAYFDEHGLPENMQEMRVVQRKSTLTHLARLATVRPSQGDVFYLRLLLLNFPARSFSELRTVDGVVYNSFQDACIAHGLFSAQDEALYAMREARDVALYTPAQLRRLFIDILVNDCADTPNMLWAEFRDDLSHDFLLQFNDNLYLAHGRTLAALQRSLDEYGKTLEEYGLPRAFDMTSEISHELDKWCSNRDVLRREALRYYEQFNDEQCIVYDSLMTVIRSHRQLIAYLDGRAGRGKTFLINAIIARMRSTGAIVLPSATSGFAAQLYPGGRTTHSLFKIPVNANNELLDSTVGLRSSRGDLLLQSDLIIVDEAPMGNKIIFACMDDLLRRLTSVDTPFGGKNILFVGDFRQTCPVIRGGSRAQVVAASLRSSPLWPFFRIHSLHEPVRNRDDPDFATFVDNIGDGPSSRVSLTFEGLAVTDSEAHLTAFVWPDDVIGDPLTSLSRAILAPTNAQVDHYNSTVLDRLPGECHLYYSADSLKEAGDEGLDADDGILDYYASRTPPGFPSHTLKVKINGIYRILRNLSIDKGLVKNTRVVVTSTHRRLVGIRRISRIPGRVELDAEEILLPRISFPHEHERGHTLLRRQFPLAPAYATTFNSCQGLTLDIIRLDLRRDVFSHGQLYTALTRIRNRHNAMIYWNTNQTDTQNVVFDEILI